MSKTAREISTLALFGLAVGLMLGGLAAGAYTTWRTGGNIANTGFGAFFEHAPWVVGGFKEPFKTGLMILAGVAAVLAVGGWAAPRGVRGCSLSTPPDKGPRPSPPTGGGEGAARDEGDTLL